MNITNELAESILNDIGYKKAEKIEEKKEVKAEEPKVEPKAEVVEHTCPLCNSKLEEDITDESIETFVNSLVIEESKDEDEDESKTSDKK